MGMLAGGLKSCCFCQQPIQLKNVVDEKKIWPGKVTLHPAQLWANKYCAHR